MAEAKKSLTIKVLVRDTCYRDGTGELKVDTHVFEVVKDVVEVQVEDGVIRVEKSNGDFFMWPLSNVLRCEAIEIGTGE